MYHTHIQCSLEAHISTHSCPTPRAPPAPYPQDFLLPGTAGRQLLSDVAQQLGLRPLPPMEPGAGKQQQGGAGPGQGRELGQGQGHEKEGAVTSLAQPAGLSTQHASGPEQEQTEQRALPGPGPEAVAAAAAAEGPGTPEGGGGGGDRGDPRELWVVDCIDSVAPKMALVAAAHAAGMRVVSSMGAGGFGRA